MTPGTRLTNAIMLALSERGCMVWRNVTGTAYQGRKVHSDGRTITLADSRVIVFGLVGSADIIGLTPEGQFIGIEVKAGTDQPSNEQRAWVKAVTHHGGRAGFARSVQEAVDILTN